MRTKVLSLLLALMLPLTACGPNTAAADAQSTPPTQSVETAPLAAQTDSFSDVPDDADYAQVAVALYNAPKDREENVMKQITLSFNDHAYTATLADNSSAEAFAQLLESGPLTVSAHDYGNFEKVGDLGTELPRNDEQITTSPGDIILYQGDQITVYYAQNSWSFTRLGRIDDPSGLREALGDGDVDITFQLAEDA